MIAWTLEAISEAACFDRVVVSTDDTEIAQVARDLGAEVPFMRPADLADSFTGTGAVVSHAIRALAEAGERPTTICCVYATNPLLRASDLLRGRDLLASGKWQYVFAATRFAAPVPRGFLQAPDGSASMLWPEHAATRSQDLPTVFHDAAQFYWGTPSAWLNGSVMFGPDSTFVQIPSWRSVDIDTEDDWRRAEILFQALKQVREH
jgi:N-acylneuraminate cytidylyltransferase